MVVEVLRAAGCVYAEEEAALLTEAAGSPEELGALVARRVAGEPLEYVVGWASFAGFRIAVSPGVFVPRRRTEALAREAAALVGPSSVVVDLCCGSGAIAVVLAAAGAREVYAADLDPVATACARTNLAASEAVVTTADLYDALSESLAGRIDVLAANVPYVPTDEIALMPPEARDHEPRPTLDGGTDGLGVLRRVAREAARWLAPGGTLLTEASERQAAAALDIVEAAGLVPRLVTDDDLGATVVIGSR